MKTLTELGIKKQCEHFYSSISHGIIILDGKREKIEFLKKEFKDNKIRVYFFLDDSIKGKVEEIEIIDSEGDAVASCRKEYMKSSQEGLYLVLQYSFVEEED